MITTALPNPENAGKTPDDSSGGNVVVYAATSSKYRYPEHLTPYLFVTNFVSQGDYIINNRPATANDKCFYLLQAGSKLAIDFKRAQPLQTLLILFNTHFINQAIYEHTTSTEVLLDNPQQLHENDFYVPAVPFMVNDTLKLMLGNITHNPHMSGQQLQYALLDIVAQFCTINAETAKQIQRTGSVKKATGEELYRRLSTARMFMEDNACATISVDDIAKEACLNSFHFLRTFKQVYNTTPHQYLIQLKLNKAFDMLKRQRSSVSDACFAVGFESVGSFSNLFKRRFGVTPSQVAHKLPHLSSVI